MNSPEIKEFIYQHSNLFWYTPEDKEGDISHDYLVERVLYYGDLDTVKQLFHLLGIKKVADIFFHNLPKGIGQKGYYHELIENYFTLVFKRYCNEIFEEAK
jgi:hypothetical protein